MPPTTPSSVAQIYCVSLSDSVRQRNFKSPSPCDRCISKGLVCYKMPDNPKLKCSECIRRGRPCAANSLEALDHSERNLREELARDEEQLSELLAKVMRKRKVLEQARKKAEERRNCLVREMEASGEDLTAVASDVAALGSDFSDEYWALAGAQLDTSWVPDGTSLGVLDTR